LLKARLGERVFNSWLKSLEFDAFDGRVLKATVPVKFHRSWIQTHYVDVLRECADCEFPGVERVDVALRTPAPVKRAADLRDARPPGSGGALPSSSEARSHAVDSSRHYGRSTAPALGTRNGTGPGDGSPLDSRYTFESFVVGSTNRMAHAGAVQVAETVLAEQRNFNPVVIHAAVGLGKTHLLQAIAWEVRRRAPHANVLYITAEKFRFQFVEALRSPDPLAFKERFRFVDILIIDDFEFMGERTEIELDHIINALLDGGRQVVVASSRAPSYIERLNERMRSRLQKGLVTEIQAPDYDLRLKILERRLAEKRATEPSFDLSREILELLATKLTESARELEGAINRLHFHWQTSRGALSPEAAETMVRDLVSGLEPRRIRIEDILRVIVRHFGVSRGDILSQRRHRSVVWPRQIGMYLAKQMTARSLPEIGRRFGNRDHTTVLHAIRKIEGELKDDARLREELDDLKKQIMQ
jgi:chromosomal replication initiator protein